MRFGFFLRESLRAMRRSAAPSFAALATVLVTMLVLGVFIPIVQATNSAANSVRNRVEVDVYMKTDATSAQEARVRRELLAVSNVKRVDFESKQQAYAQQSKQDPQAYALLAANPLPDTFHVVPNNPSDVLSIRAALTPRLPGGGTGMIDPTIQNVSNHRSDTKKILQVTNLVTITAAALAVLLTIASILLIANTIRLSLYARRREVEVMKLVGATDWFIRWPFVIEGTIVGGVGALLAIVVLGLTKVLVLDPLANNWALISAPHTIPFVGLVAVLLLASIGVSALGSGLSLRRFLRV
ncbi:MAG TPA: permease-like cell division protein FtsX [Solirubrobacteraceae bacterium]|jgi:cell division transport system permease protein|nr:permease-like cell division protein FtsX [Solirubrobacteraceae bacterium]